MKVHIEYVFDTEQIAYRFLNTAAHLEAEALVAKLGRTDHHVKVTYRYADGDFDRTASELDDLARKLGGEEAA